MHVTTRQVVEAPATQAWAEVSDIENHVRWMADAASITFVTEQRRGVGTQFDCVTRIGPLRTIDRMVVTGWEEGDAIEVQHRGLVTGEGRLSVAAAADAPDQRCVVSWTEQLTFPWYLGGRLGAWLARPIFQRLWRANLRRLATLVQGRHT